MGTLTGTNERVDDETRMPDVAQFLLLCNTERKITRLTHDDDVYDAECVPIVIKDQQESTFMGEADNNSPCARG